MYKCQDILLFKECYALEKIHGTSAHILWQDERITFFSGGVSHHMFIKLFDEQKLKALFTEYFGNKRVCVYGEAYGSSCQGMSATYGKELRFVAFDVQIEESWLDVPNASQVATRLGLEFVHYVKVPTELDALNAERDADSVQAVRNGMGPGKMREGVVLRPLMELTKNNGDRVICKHKRAEFSETKSKRVVDDPAKLQVLEEANAVAEEWVTPQRLQHVVDKIPGITNDMVHTPVIIKAMIEDVRREAAGEIVESKEVFAAIGRKTAKLWKEKVTNI